MISVRQTIAVAACVVVLVSSVAAHPAAAQPNDTQPAVTLQATGTFARGGEFQGAITINRFEARGNSIVAIGFVRGLLQRGGRTLGTALAGEVTFPVVVRSGGFSSARGHAAAAPQVMRIASFTSPPPPGRFRLVQAEACPVLEVMLTPGPVDLLGVQVTITPITVNLQGQPGTPLGDAVCEGSELISNVVALVGVLNSVLGLLTTLLGGLLGGLGGAIPGVG